MRAHNRFFFPLLCLSFTLFLFQSCRKPQSWRTFTLLYFDTICEIKIYCGPEIEHKAAEKCKTLFSEVEIVFSPDSRNLNHPMALELFRRAQKIHEASGGDFDITVAPLSRLWGFRDESHRVPPPHKIQETLQRIGMEKTALENGWLILPENMEWDWGAVAKGYGIDRAVGALKELDIERGFINAGGDLFCWGVNPENEPWKIGVKHPRKSGILGILSLKDEAAATTGDYQRFFIEAGVRYHHVFDPKTGYPARGRRSVTVIGPEAVLCDALSTALFISRNPEALLEKYSRYGAVLVDDKGTVTQMGKVFPFRPVQ